MNDLVQIALTSTQLFEGLNTITSLIHEQHILQMPSYLYFNQGKEQELVDIQKQPLEQLILEVTQDCNLRCKYCIFNEDYDRFRGFSNTHMDWSTAKAAIDYGLTYSGEEFILGFYGGEPLLNWKLIKQCIEYAKQMQGAKKITYSFTSNFTMLTDEMAKYIASLDDVQILCSLDGPKEIQDRYRVSAGQIGSFDQTLSGLKRLIDELKERASSNIAIHSVITPPHTKKRLDSIKSFFESITWLPKDIKFIYSYLSDGSLKEEGIEDRLLSNQEYYAQDIEKSDPIKAWATNIIVNPMKSDHYALSLESNAIYAMHERVLVDEARPIINRGGCCTVGRRRIYVTSEGDFKVCEKMGESPSIGHVNQGLDIKAITKYYLDEFDEASLEDCTNCWAVHLCSMCYSACYNENGLDYHRKKDLCHAARANARNRLIEYYQILEENPDMIQKIIEKNLII